MDTNTAIVPTDAAGIAAHLDAARGALAEARDQYRRVEIRDQAAALAAAAEVMRRRDIQVEFSILVADAERAIAANSEQQKPGPKTKSCDRRSQNILPISSATIRRLRSIHSAINDDMYQKKTEIARKRQEPLTRQTLHMEARKTRERLTADQRAAREALPPATEPLKFLHCSCADLADHVEAGSADLVLCDPPYMAKFVWTYGDVARFASHALRPGGSLLALLGHLYIPESLACMTGQGLDFYAMLSVGMPGGASRLWARRLRVTNRLVVWYTKNSYAGQLQVTEFDIQKFTGQDTRYHIWGQSEELFEALLQKFVVPGEMVIDPFLGGGTTAIASHRRGCRFVGCDVDLDAVSTSRARLVEAGAEVEIVTAPSGSRT